ncbi:zinc finger protein 407 [Lepisosteus oculatus]|uniref:zinc finger protein 407 n=1 Tax=Lepisosteus oculatus TaxID=7918 RepID=UPI0035F50571
MDNQKSSSSEEGKGVGRSEKSNKMVKESNNKRKLRTGKDVLEGGGDGSETKAEDQDGAGSQAKRTRSEEDKDPGESESCEPENRQGEGKNDQATADGCTCPHCHFLAKNPVALKVHMKRKHSRKIPKKVVTTGANKESRAKKILSGKGIEDLGKVEGEISEAYNENSCPQCSFKAESAVLLEEHIKVKHKDVSCAAGGMGIQAHQIEKTNLQKQSITTRAQIKRLICKSQEMEALDCTTSEIKGAMKKTDHATGQSESSKENEENRDSDMEIVDQTVALENENSPIKSKGNEQSCSGKEMLNPTQILMNMVELTPLSSSIEDNGKNVKENESKGIDNADNGSTTQHTDATLDKDLFYVGATPEMNVESAEAHHNSEPTTDSLLRSTNEGINSNVEVQLNVAEISEDQESSVCQVTAVSKTDKRRLKAKSDKKSQPTCNYCGNGFRDKQSLVMHVKRRHTKEMSFFCEPCTYACVAKGDYEKHCQSNRHKTKTSEISRYSGTPAQVSKAEKQKDTFEIEVQIPRENSKPTATQVAAAHLLKRSATTRGQLQCKSCIYKTSSSTVLLRHVRLKHSKEYHFRCKVCDYYTVSSEGMEAHIARKKHAELAQKENLGSSFEDSVEEVCVNTSDVQKILKKDILPSEIQAGEQLPDPAAKLTSEEAMGNIDETTEVGRSKTKRGRPKGCTSTSCNYCGLIASSATNLSVHIRRRHSRQYSYACKLCNYYCVTKGDMDRHCATKKHKSRVESVRNINPEDDQVYPDGVVEVLNNGQAASVEVQGDVSEAAAMEAEIQEEAILKPSEGESAIEGAVASIPSHNEDSVENLTGPEQVEVVGDEPDPESAVQRKSKYDSVNSCTHCSFVAHSLSSLDLHIKRKHTKDFEFYCMACNYYAVTRREMTRHAMTEKHKQKSQTYLETAKKNEKDLVRAPAETPTQSEGDGESHETSPVESLSVENGTLKHTEERQRENNTSENDETCSGQDAEMSELKSDSLNHNSDTNQVNEENAKVNMSEDIVLSQDNAEKLLDVSSEAAELKDSQGPSLEVTQLSKSVKDDIRSKASQEIVMEKEVEKESLLQADNDFAVEGLPETSTDLEATDGGSATPLPSKQLVRAIPFDACIVPLKPSSDSETADNDAKQSSERSALSSYSSACSSEKEVRKRKKADGPTRNESVRIRCEDCGFMADGLSGLNVHISMKHPSKEKHFHCLLCGKSFYTESNLHQHLTSVGHLKNEQASIEELPEGGATFKCVKCTDPFETEQELFMHIKEKHEELLREVNKYILEDTEQVNREREENQGNVCKYCGKVCKSSNSMAFLAHIRTHTGSKPFKCKLCKFATAQLGDARNHVKRHLGMREYKCHVCGWAFVMKKHLNTHLLGKHGVGRPKERKFECEVCDRSFSEKWALNNHMKLHTGQKPYKCAWPTCHYSFLTLSAMRDHYRTHTGEKSFLCDLCGFAGGTRHALTKHRRQHTGEKPFRCDLCSFASTTQSHLTRHKRVHTGEKPYRCPWCDYRSNCAENIRKHILHTGKHEGVKMYNCPKCSYGSNAPMDFRNHLKEMHPDIENPDLAYLHAGIVSKSFECRLKGQGASFVETDSAFTAGASDDSSHAKERVVRSSRKPLAAQTEAVQQVIIIQGFPEGYGGEYAIDASMEESAAATLQTLAMGGQVTEVVHITEDGQVIATSGSSTHMSSMIPGQIEIPEGTTQVVVVESPMEEASCEELMAGQEATVHTTETSSALDALLCAVTELGTVKEQQQQQGLAKAVEDESHGEPCESEIVTTEMSEEPSTEEMQVFHEVQEGAQPMEVVTQVVQSSSVPTPQGSSFKEVVQEVLQFAVCDMATAGQLMKEGLTQVIVNNEGAVHMVAREGSQIIMQEDGHVISMPSQHMDLVSSDGEISQIIVTEGIAHAMVQNSSQNFSGENTHYIVTELDDSTLQVEGTVYSQDTPDKSPSQSAVYHGEECATVGTEGVDATVVPSAMVSEQLAGMVVYSDHTSQEQVVEECENAVMQEQ